MIDDRLCNRWLLTTNHPILKAMMTSILLRTTSRQLNKPQICSCLAGRVSSTKRTQVHKSQNQTLLQRVSYFSAVPSHPSTTTSCAIENTPLDSPKGATLLQGLDIHIVHSEDDGHPLAVYTMRNNDNNESLDYDNSVSKQRRTPVLLLHGRTWSSLPVYHLTGQQLNNSSSSSTGGTEENRSLIQALYNHNIQPYSMDFRGFGGTPKDTSGFVEPLKCVSDVVSVLNWIHEKHCNEDIDETEEKSSTKPALLGWSHGALIAQITAQRHSNSLSKLILYGSIYNPSVKYAIPPTLSESPQHSGYTDHEDFPLHELASQNEFEGAMEDFTNVSNEARIFPPISAKLFAEAALVCDPTKAAWWNLHQLNECKPSLVNVPTMVVSF